MFAQQTAHVGVFHLRGGIHGNGVILVGIARIEQDHFVYRFLVDGGFDVFPRIANRCLFPQASSSMSLPSIKS